jgi:hypothetical protein
VSDLPAWMERARSAEPDASRVETIRAAVAAAWPALAVALSVVRGFDGTATAVLTMRSGERLVMTTTVHGHDADDALDMIDVWAPRG